MQFGQFLEWTGMAVSAAIKNPLQELKKILLFWAPMNPSKDWKAKLERAHFSKVQSSKITV